MSRARMLAVVVAVLVALPAVRALDARAQILPTSTTTTSTTEPPSSSTTTTAAPPPTTPSTIVGPTTTASTTSTTEAPTSTSSTEVGPGDAPPAAGTAQTIPPQYAAYLNLVKRSPPNGTATLLGAIQPLLDLGMTQQEAIAATFGHFPVAGVANFSDDWWYARFNQPFHLHQGTDIFAPMGTPIRAPADGVMRHGNGGLGGMSVYVTQPDGTYFYMAHMSAFVDGQADGTVVRTGDIVGFVGNTGDAAGGPTHCHFEIHMAPASNPYLRPAPPQATPATPAPTTSKRTKPSPTSTTTTAPKRARATTTTTAPPPVIIGDIHDPVLYGSGKLPATDPKPFLDQWLAEDLANLPKVIAAAEGGKPRAIIDTGMTRRFADGRGGELAGPTGPPRSQLLWASSASPAGGALRLAEAEASAVAGEIDYDALAPVEASRLAQIELADLRARLVLGPLTPPALREILRLSPPPT